MKVIERVMAVTIPDICDFSGLSWLEQLSLAAIELERGAARVER